MMTSLLVIMPRSPWLASPGCTKYAGVPVLDMVAAILRAMWPDLPMPLTITRPSQGRRALPDGRGEPRAGEGERGEALAPPPGVHARPPRAGRRARRPRRELHAPRHVR